MNLVLFVIVIICHSIEMSIYSIKDIEKLTGIKAHTLRIWEKRYGFIQTKRTPTNIRYFTEEDLSKLLNISLLNKNGFKISRIANLSPKEISEKSSAISSHSNNPKFHFDELTLSMIEMDEYKFTRIYEQHIKKSGFKNTMLEVIFPFFEKLGVLWLTGTLNYVQENYLVGLLKQKIYSEIEKLPFIPSRKKKKVMIFLSEGETQILNILFIYYILKLNGYHVINIGYQINIEDIRSAYQIHHPDYLFTFFIENTTLSMEHFMQKLSDITGKSLIITSGYPLIKLDIKPGKKIKHFDTIYEMVSYIEKMQGVNKSYSRI